MMKDRIVSIDISGFKAIDDARVPLEGLTVLIGENGSGKSSVLEALAIVGSAARQAVHVQDVLERGYGRFETILRRGSHALRFEVAIQGDGPPLQYGFSVGLAGVYPTILDEWLYQGQLDLRKDECLILGRQSPDRARYRTTDGGWGEMGVGGQALGAPFIGAAASPGLRRLLETLEAIEVHPPFDVRPVWQQKELKISEGPRWPAPLEPVPRLRRYGTNLPSAFHELRNTGGDVWDRVVTNARLGLGADLQDIRLPARGRGNIELELVFGSFPGQALPAEALSEGQLSYLGFIALCELGSQRSILAVDEPELHLHPALLARVVSMLEEAACAKPVLLATHSDRLLDALSAPVESVVLCSLDEHGAMRLRRPDRERLEDWLADYAGLGRIRAEGYESHVFGPPEDRSSEP